MKEMYAFPTDEIQDLCCQPCAINANELRMYTVVVNLYSTVFACYLGFFAWVQTSSQNQLFCPAYI